jgi:hypothetical protein
MRGKKTLFKSKNIFILVGCLLLSIVILAGILVMITSHIERFHSQIGDGGFLSGVPCGAPCFLGITVDQTTDDGVRAILQGKGISKQCSTNTAETGELGIVCTFPGGGPNGSLGYIGFGFKTKGDFVNSIGFFPGVTITLQEVIAKYGPPKHIIIWDCCNVERPQSNFALFYNNPYMKLELKPQDYLQCDLEPTNQIVSISYLNATEYDESIKVLEEDPDWWKNYGDQWKGYGKCE